MSGSVSDLSLCPLVRSFGRCLRKTPCRPAAQTPQPCELSSLHPCPRVGGDFRFPEVGRLAGVLVYFLRVAVFEVVSEQRKRTGQLLSCVLAARPTPLGFL